VTSKHVLLRAPDRSLAKPRPRTPSTVPVRYNRRGRTHTLHTISPPHLSFTVNNYNPKRPATLSFSPPIVASPEL
jgi:hypothetical protein